MNPITSRATALSLIVSALLATPGFASNSAPTPTPAPRYVQIQSLYLGLAASKIASGEKLRSLFESQIMSMNLTPQERTCILSKSDALVGNSFMLATFPLRNALSNNLYSAEALERSGANIAASPETVIEGGSSVQHEIDSLILNVSRLHVARADLLRRAGPAIDCLENDQ